MFDTISFFHWIVPRVRLTRCWGTQNRAWVGNLKQRVSITSKFSKFKGATHHYVVKLPKSAGTRHYCPKIPRVPGTLDTRANSSPAKCFWQYFGLIYLTKYGNFQPCTGKKFLNKVVSEYKLYHSVDKRNSLKQKITLFSGIELSIYQQNYYLQPELTWITMAVLTLTYLHTYFTQQANS